MVPSAKNINHYLTKHQQSGFCLSEAKNLFRFSLDPSDDVFAFRHSEGEARRILKDFTSLPD